MKPSEMRKSMLLELYLLQCTYHHSQGHHELCAAYTRGQSYQVHTAWSAYMAAAPSTPHGSFVMSDADTAAEAGPRALGAACRSELKSGYLTRAYRLWEISAASPTFPHHSS